MLFSSLLPSHMSAKENFPNYHRSNIETWSPAMYSNGNIKVPLPFPLSSTSVYAENPATPHSILPSLLSFFFAFV